MFKYKIRSVFINEFSSWLASRIYILSFSIVEQLSLRSADKFGRFLGSLLFRLTVNRRKIVEGNVQVLKDWAVKQNLKNSFLDLDNKTITKKIYQYNAANFFYSFALMNKSKVVIENHIKICNLELLNKLHKKNKGVIMLFSHAGPFELPVLLPKLVPSIFDNCKLAGMYRPLNNRYMDKWYLRKRRRFGTLLFSRLDGFLKIIRHVKNGAFMNIAVDVRMRQGEKIELFGKLASTSKIPFALHKATRAPIVFVSFVRADHLSWEIQFEELSLPENGLFSEIDLLKAINQNLEQKIFENPYDYFFFQDRYQ